MSIQALQERQAELRQELAAKRQRERVEQDLEVVEAKLASERKRRLEARRAWVDAMIAERQKWQAAESEEKQILEEINKVLPGLLSRLGDVRAVKTQAVVDILSIFESQEKTFNFERVQTVSHFATTMREANIRVADFPQWASRRRLHGEFFKSEYQSANTGLLKNVINDGVAVMKK